MIVCVCKAVSEGHIRAAVKAGASSIRDLTRGLRVGTCCGKCIPEAQATLDASLRQRHDPPSAAYFPASVEFAV
jgi:bacterioferritin-associated ferredoxin